MTSDLYQKIQSYIDRQQWQEAWQLCAPLLQETPTPVPVWVLAGQILGAGGQLQQGLQLLKQAMQQAPDQGEVYWRIGVLLIQAGQHAIAGELFEQGVKKDPDHGSLREAYADWLVDQGDVTEAVRHYRLLLFAQNQNPALHQKIAQALHLQGELVAAQRHYETALSLKEDVWLVWYGLGKVWLEQGRCEEALHVYTQGRALGEQLATFDNAIGLALMEKDDVTGAIEVYRRGLAVEPHNQILHYNLGNALRAFGDLEGARQVFKMGMQQHPNHPYFLLGTAQLTKLNDVDDPLIQRMEQMVQQSDQPVQKRIDLGYGLGRALDQVQAYDRAFSAYTQANTLRYTTQGCSDLNHYLDVIKRIKVAFQHPSQALITASCHPVTPIFVMGMFRSGSTLVEQILGSHPQIATTGERSILADLVDEQPKRMGFGAVYPEYWTSMGVQEGAELATTYLHTLREVSDRPADTAVTHMTDKLLFNYLYLGVIAELFPGARVVHTVRNPLDTCLSIYFQNFTRGQRWMQSLEEIGHYYVAYHNLMNHWRNVLPIKIYDVIYEDVVENPHLEVERLLDYLALPWHEGCLSFHTNKRAVQTASAQQVRQPIYKSSKQRWRNYEAQLSRLKEILGALNSSELS
ncbi:tetratricopeptide repeat-containing sulfotransferase family protein [Magnetococcus sp. PR-3]|uniref:tetratricopeptide repeat-containing sulfotransferase family protein n=1 Tax=Magnetococcus sp. PR-3 TaxID=3120355 RepID=UPI002FCDF901